MTAVSFFALESLTWGKDKINQDGSQGDDKCSGD